MNDSGSSHGFWHWYAKILEISKKIGIFDSSGILSGWGFDSNFVIRIENRSKTNQYLTPWHFLTQTWLFHVGSLLMIFRNSQIGNIFWPHQSESEVNQIYLEKSIRHRILNINHQCILDKILLPSGRILGLKSKKKHSHRNLHRVLRRVTVFFSNF